MHRKFFVSLFPKASFGLHPPSPSTSPRVLTLLISMIYRHLYININHFQCFQGVDKLDAAASFGYLTIPSTLDKVDVFTGNFFGDTYDAQGYENAAVRIVGLPTVVTHNVLVSLRLGNWQHSTSYKRGHSELFIH